MNKNMIRNAGLPILALFLASLLSCDNSFGIFSSIQQETKQTGTNVFLNGTVKKVVGDGTSYFAAMAKIYTRLVTDTVGSDAWKVLTIATSTGTTISDYACTSLTEGSVSGVPTVFAALSNRVTGELLGLYSTVDHGVSWTELASSGIPSSGYIQSIFFVNNTLFASVRKKVSGVDVYDLLYRTATGFVSAGTAVTAVDSPFIDGVWDGTNYWFAETDGLYAGTSPAVIAAVSETGGPTSKTLTGFCVNPATNDVYVSTDDGYVYMRQKSGGSWTNKLVLSDVSLGTIIVIPAGLNPGGTGIRLAIARNDSVYGYMEYDWAASQYYAGASGELTSSESNYSTTLSGVPVLSFYLSSAENRLFVTGIASNLDSRYGLYSDGWSATASSWGGWEAE